MSKVSIIVPCYNSEKWIEQCLRSALSQTYADVEVIFVDNDSIDESVVITERLKGEFPELLISSAKNIHPYCWDEPRLKGMQLATGQYILTIGSDDYIMPDFIQNCMEFINKSRDKILAFQSPMKGVESNTGRFTTDIKHKYNSLQQFKEQCLRKCPVNTPTVIFNRSLFDDGLLETFPGEYSGAADYDLYCRLADNGVFIWNCPYWLGFIYRWHKEQATWDMHKSKVNYDAKIQNYWREKWKI